MTFPISTVGIIGLGLIGTSLARAIRHNQVAETIIGTDINEEALRACQEEQLIDSIVPLEALPQRCELIILAVPPEAMGATISALKPHLTDDIVLTDVASVKLPVLKYLEQEFPEGIAFIPGHPIAGGTKTGPQSAEPNIFERKLVMLTPPQGVDINDPALQLVQSFWQNLDSIIELVPADVHDLIYGYVSHLPHMMAFAASHVLSNDNTGTPDDNDALKRFLRLGDSDPRLWCDITLSNQAAVVEALRTYLAMLSHIRTELSDGAAENDNEPADADNKDCTLAACTLFPRIAASCLVATVSILERQSGQRLARYSGAGFADVASPAVETPENDLEKISNHAKKISELLGEYEKQLEAITTAIESSQSKQLETLLQDMHDAYKVVERRFAA